MDNHDMEGNRETTGLGHIHGDEGFRSYRLLLIRCAESRRLHSISAHWFNSGAGFS